MAASYPELHSLLTQGMGIPFAFHHWDAPPPMPYGVYFDDHTENFGADGVVYHVVRPVNIELYARQRDPALEGRMERLLDGAGLFWDKYAEYLGDTERAYQISYEIEV